MSIPALAAGVRFNPTARQLIYYLKDKILDQLQLPTGVPNGYFCDSINPYSCDPLALHKGVDFDHYGEAFYFTQKPQNRHVQVGYWTECGWAECILADDGQLLGLKQEYYYLWTIPNKPVSDNWVMHEYRVIPYIFIDEEREAAGDKITNSIACVLCYRTPEESDED